MMLRLYRLVIVAACFFSAFSGVPSLAAAPVESKALIVDFDGTLADSFQEFVDAFNAVAPSYNVKPLTSDEIPQARAMGVQPFLKSRGLWFYQVPFIVRDIKAHFEEKTPHVKPHPEMTALIKRLHAAGYHLFIVSSHDETAIKRFLKNNELEDCFKDVYTSSFFDALYKSRKVKKLMNKHKLDAAHTLYIGDELRDIEAAVGAHVPIVCLSWGFNSRELLTAHNPTAIVDNAAELERFIDAHFATHTKKAEKAP